MQKELCDPDIDKRVDNLLKKGAYSHITKPLDDAVQDFQALHIETRINDAITQVEAEFDKLRAISTHLNKMRRISLYKREVACIPEPEASLVNKITCYWNQFTLFIRKMAFDKQTLINTYANVPQQKRYLAVSILNVKIPMYNAMVAFEDKMRPQQRKFALAPGSNPDYQRRVPDMLATWKREYENARIGKEGDRLKQEISRLDYVWRTLDAHLPPDSPLKRRDLNEAKSG